MPVRPWVEELCSEFWVLQELLDYLHGALLSLLTIWVRLSPKNLALGCFKQYFDIVLWEECDGHKGLDYSLVELHILYSHKTFK